MNDPFLHQLSQIVGPQHVLTDPDLMTPYLVEQRDLYHGAARAIVRPASTQQVSAVMALCHATRTPVVPQGGNTGLVGGQTPDASGHAVVLSLSRMSRIRDVDTSSNTMTVEAGLTLLATQQAADAADRLFPLSLASEGTCTIGGNLASNAGGTAVLAYGNARDLVLGIEAVLADGRIMASLGKLRKDNTGYDLKHLFMGSEGTLGIITAAVLKLFPKPRARETAFIALESPRAALQLLGLAQSMAGGDVTTFEILPRMGIDFVLRHARGLRDPFSAPSPWYVLLELSSQSTHRLGDTLTAILEQALTDGVASDAVIAASVSQRGDFWQLRERMSEVQRYEGGSIKHDVSVPVASVPDFLDEASRATLDFMPGARLVPFGHMGDGNIHFNVQQPVGADKAAFLSRWHDLNEVVHGIAMRYGGSISAEHGIGQLKRGELQRVKDPVALEVMRSLKAALDPHNILNPGKVI